MSVRSHVQAEFRTEFSIIEGTYKNIRVSEHCRPSRQPLFGKELSPVKVSFVSCKDKDGLCEWIVFNSAKELYFYPFDGVGKVNHMKYVDCVSAPYCFVYINKLNHILVGSREWVL